MLDEIIRNALQEDIGSGDFSTLSCVPKEAKGSAQLIVKENVPNLKEEFCNYILGLMKNKTLV